MSALDNVRALQARVAELEQLLTHTGLLKAQEEHNNLCHDIDRHVAIAAQQAQEIEQLRSDLAAARALPTAMANGYTSGSVTEHEFHSIHLHYNTRQQAVAAFEAISDAIDATLAGEKK